MNLQGWAGDKRRNVLLGDCFESCGHRFTGDPGLKGVQISFPSGCFSAERPPSGIAGWQKGLIVENGSEGTRDALLPASPVPERQTKDPAARKLERPAIS